MKRFCIDQTVQIRTMQLKVCEGCGALWLRAQCQGVYCRGCAQMLSEFPAPRRPHRGWPARKRECRVITMPAKRPAAAVQGGAR